MPRPCGASTKGRLCQRTINGVVTNLYYIGSQLVEEQDTSGNTLCNYFYGAGGERICRRDATNGNARMFYHYDARGFTTHLTDANGNVIEQYRDAILGPGQLGDEQRGDDQPLHLGLGLRVVPGVRLVPLRCAVLRRCSRALHAARSHRSKWRIEHLWVLRCRSG